MTNPMHDHTNDTRFRIVCERHTNDATHVAITAYDDDCIIAAMYVRDDMTMHVQSDMFADVLHDAGYDDNAIDAIIDRLHDCDDIMRHHR